MKLVLVVTLLVAQYVIVTVLADSFSKTRSRLIETNDIFHSTIEHHEDSPSDNRLSPIILMPGDGGSRLQAKLDRQAVTHHYCERKTNDWFDLWLNLSLLVPFALDCWVDK